MIVLITTLFSDYHYHQYKTNHMWGKCRSENTGHVQSIEEGVAYFNKDVTSK